MPGFDYDIFARIIVRDGGGPGARDAQRGVERVEMAATSAGASIGRMFALLGGLAGMGGVARAIVGVNSSLQDTQNGLATLYSAITGSDIGVSFRAAEADVLDLTKAAREGVGELDDYIQGYQKILGPGLAAGASRDMLRRITAEAIAAAGATSHPLWMGPSDVQQSLTQGAHGKTTPVVSLALAAAKISEAQFNAASTLEKIAYLDTAFGKFAPGIALMGRSWSANFSTLPDNLKGLFRAATSPLFETWTSQLRTLNDYLEANRDRLAEIAETWGGRLVRMWDTLISRAGTYSALVAASAFAPGLASIGRAGFALGANAAAGGAGLSGGAALLEIGTAATWAAVPLGLAAAGILSLRGAMREFPEDLDMLSVKATTLGNSLGGLLDSMDGLTAKGSALNVIGDLLFKIGGVALDGADGLARLAASIITITGATLQAYGSFGAAEQAIATGNFGALPGIKATLDANTASMYTALGKIWQSPEAQRAQSLSDANRDRFINGGPKGSAELNPVKKGGDNVFNGPVTVHVNVERNDDPARVVDSWHKGMDRLKQASTSAQRLPTLQGA